MVTNIGNFNMNKIHYACVTTFTIIFMFKCMIYIVFEGVYLKKKKKKIDNTYYDGNLFKIEKKISF